MLIAPPWLLQPFPLQHSILGRKGVHGEVTSWALWETQERDSEGCFATCMESRWWLSFGSLLTVEVGAAFGGALGVAASPLVVPGLALAALVGGAGGYQWAKYWGSQDCKRHEETSNDAMIAHASLLVSCTVQSSRNYESWVFPCFSRYIIGAEFLHSLTEWGGCCSDQIIFLVGVLGV